MEPVERRTNTFAALGAATEKKKKTGPPTVASIQHQAPPQVFLRSRDVIEGSWADDSFDEQPSVAKNGVLVDEDGFVTKPIKGGKKAAMFQAVVEAPVQDAGFDDDEEEEEESETDESSEEEDEEDVDDNVGEGSGGICRADVESLLHGPAIVCNTICASFTVRVIIP